MPRARSGDRLDPGVLLPASKCLFAVLNSGSNGKPMTKYITIRFLQSLIAILAITMIVFSLTRLTGSPIDSLLPDDATPAQIQALVDRWGLDQPVYMQYFSFIGSAMQGDFGEALSRRGTPAMTVVMGRLPATLELAVVAVLMSILFALPLGVIAAVNKGTFIDKLANIIALFGQSLPQFWLGIILIWIFAVNMGLLPSSGRGGVQHILLPAFAMALFQIAAITRLTRSGMLEVLDSEYIKLARIKGVPEWKVIWKHAFRNALIIPLTYFGILLGSILTGSIVIETVFSWPGIGQLAMDAIRGRDYPLVQAVVILFAVIFVLANFIVDILYAYVDPRIRY